jgi:hypothetical protein
METAASIIPGDTSHNEDSTILAMIGIAPIVRGTIVATVPIEDPVINLVTGMNNTNNINKDLDIDGVITKLEDKLTERLEAVAEGVYT